MQKKLVLTGFVILIIAVGIAISLRVQNRAREIDSESQALPKRAAKHQEEILSNESDSGDAPGDMNDWSVERGRAAMASALSGDGDDRARNAHRVL